MWIFFLQQKRLFYYNYIISKIQKMFMILLFIILISVLVGGVTPPTLPCVTSDNSVGGLWPPEEFGPRTHLGSQPTLRSILTQSVRSEELLCISGAHTVRFPFQFHPTSDCSV